MERRKEESHRSRGLLPARSLRARRSSRTTALAFTKRRCKKLRCGEMNGNILFIILVGARSMFEVWDEWVAADRLLKFSEENVAKQKMLEKNQNVDKSSKSGRSTQSKPKSSNAFGLTDGKADKEDLKNQAPRGKKRKGQSLTEEKGMRSADKLMLQFPPTLKKQLVDDWEFVTQLGKLVKLPRSPNVDEILKKYLEYRVKKDGMLADSVVEILKGIRIYFDKALPLMLLYKKERQQYQEVIHDDISPSIIYGAEHLLRLFVKLPELISSVNIEDDTLGKLQQKLLDFLKFLQKNQNSFFLSTYDGSRSSDRSDD
ncbi:hypothetical protein HPP92_002637 [Vanilla planifolia]|uniref:MRG domain-containing protein n=1 Tax=Vanilla planifolia TaxID=51239 RepID=A0A835S1J8_VANPL|nr:hypothetical protein HPP92_002637 [Vanilla planifolia]